MQILVTRLLCIHEMSQYFIIHDRFDFLIWMFKVWNISFNKNFILL